MYQSWQRDQEEKVELARSHGILIGSFTNYEAAKKMLERDNPKISSTEEEFEQATNKVIEDRDKYLKNKKEDNTNIKRRRKVIKR